uniref:Alternative protein RAPSN n=1 Tax=Homo sapiens TaxID=9606 RepID=L8EBB2_HUMAN|nr:alternative protein RAPSN [Homo sapiens]
MPSWASASSRRPWRASRRPCAMPTTMMTPCSSAACAAAWAASMPRSRTTRKPCSSPARRQSLSTTMAKAGA